MIYRVSTILVLVRDFFHPQYEARYVSWLMLPDLTRLQHTYHRPSLTKWCTSTCYRLPHVEQLPSCGGWNMITPHIWDHFQRKFEYRWDRIGHQNLVVKYGKIMNIPTLGWFGMVKKSPSLAILIVKSPLLRAGFGWWNFHCALRPRCDPWTLPAFRGMWIRISAGGFNRGMIYPISHDDVIGIQPIIVGMLTTTFCWDSTIKYI